MSPASSATIKLSLAVVSPVTRPDTYFEPKCAPLMLNTCTECDLSSKAENAM